jgi:signal transduction histidine kinase
VGMVVPPPTFAPVADRLMGRHWPAISAAAVTTGVATIVVMVSVGLTPSSQGDAERPLALGLAGIMLAAVLAVAPWLLIGEHPGSAAGLSVVGMAWLLPGLSAWPLLPAQGRASLLAAAPISAAGIALTVTGWRPGTTDRRGPLFATVGLASAAAATHLLGYDPFLDPACRWTCGASPAVLSGTLGPRNALGVSAVLTAAASGGAVVACMRSRAAPRSIRLAGVFASILVALAAAPTWWWWGRGEAWWVEDLVQSLGTGVIVAAVLVVLLRTNRVRRNVRDIAEQLAGAAPLVGAGAVTTIQFAVPHDGRWVNAAGQPVSTGHPEHCAVLSDLQGEAVRLVLGRWADAGQVLGSITPAGRLALENAHLQAAGLARLADVQASQRRIVEATDLERRRIERDLHDGAQQRLVAVLMQLSSARRRFSATPQVLTEGEALVREALDALRDLSHDSLTEVLYAEGLAAAVEDLVARLPLRVDIDIDDLVLRERHLPPAAQMAAYVTVAAALDNVATHARTDHAHVTFAERGDELIVWIAHDGHDGADSGRGLSDVADRVGALGGTLEVTRGPGGGTNVMARLPCGL